MRSLHVAWKNNRKGAKIKALSRARELLPQAADFQQWRRQPRRDVLAGVTVAMVALPLALAFGISSGLGAGAGIATAIVAGLVAAIFGGSNLQVSGPTGAMTVVLLPIFARFGVDGVLVVGMMAGIILIALSVMRAGRYVQFIPLPVVEGFTLGIAFIIGLQQIPAALGESGEGEKIVSVAASAARAWAASPSWLAPAIAVGVAAAMLIGARVRPGFPVSIVAVVGATALISFTGLDIQVIGDIPRGLPAPGLPAFPLDQLSALLLPAIAVAALAALESLLSATVADAMSVGERHDSDRELFGQGLANIVTPLFGGVPATAAIARTAVNVRSGARSRLSAVTQSIVLLVVVLAAAQLVGRIPLAALAGVLIATAIQMVKVSNLRGIIKATRADAVVLVVTAAATIALDLVTAVLLGLAVAGIAALREVARSAHLEETPLDTRDHTAEEQDLLAEHVVAYRLEGSLFFGAAHTFLLELSAVNQVRVVILRMARIQTLDATGASVLAETIEQLEGRGITVLLSGIKPEHQRTLEQLGVYEQLAHERHVFTRTPDAIEHARRHVTRAPH